MKACITKLWAKILENKWEVLLVMGLLAIAGIAHGWNMFHYPYYEDDEGTYVSQAWSTISHGKLTPYTYVYDHAPTGWLFLGVWLLISGGSHAFGSLLNSGRVFMLVLHILSALLLYLIAKRISGSKLTGAIAVLIFSLSPLGIYFQRRVLLDNIMIFWVLVSIWLIQNYKQKLRYILLSALAMGVAVLSKENAVFFMPPLLYLLYITVRPRHRKLAIYQWLIVSLIIISLYFLYALLKGEFFPTGSFIGGQHPHVSLLQSLQNQEGRGNFKLPWNRASGFYVNFREWVGRDPILIIAGLLATVGGILLSIKDTTFRFTTVTTVLFWIFLARDKLVIDFYIVPIIPFLALLISMEIVWIAKHLPYKIMRQAYALAMIGLLLGGYFLLTHRQYTNNETHNQVAALSWIEQNVPQNSFITMDNYAFPYLRQQNFDYKNANYFYKVQLDPAIEADMNYDWRNTNYILLTHEILKQIKNGAMPDVKLALDHSKLVASFTKGTTSYLDIPHYISTNGDWAQVYKVETKEQIVLQDAWEQYKSDFIQSYGQVVDNDTTTSEGQSYARLRAVKQNDRGSFDDVYAWTKDHMQHRPSDKLFSWKWQKINGSWKQADSNTATDADEDIAFALLQAYNQWHNKTYRKEASVIIGDTWKHEVIKQHGMFYLLPSATGPLQNGDILYNPSYVAPSYYKTFAKLDPAYPWQQLADNSYRLLNAIQNKNTGLFSNWVEFDTKGNQIPFTVANLSNTSGYDAFRTSYRLSMDSTDPRARALLKPLSNFYVSEWKKHRTISAVYRLNGAPVVPYGDLAQYGVMLNVLRITGQSKIAEQIYLKELSSKYHNGSWGNAINYYNQNWVWFGISTYGDGLPIK